RGVRRPGRAGSPAGARPGGGGGRPEAGHVRRRATGSPRPRGRRRSVPGRPGGGVQRAPALPGHRGGRARPRRGRTAPAHGHRRGAGGDVRRRAGRRRPRAGRDAGAGRAPPRQPHGRSHRHRLRRPGRDPGRAGTIRVVLVDDQELVRAGLRALAEHADDITVVGEAATGTDGLELVRAVRPDVVLMDIRMPGMDGIEATRRIVADESLGGTGVLVLTTFDEDDHVFGAIRAGAAGYLLKDVSPEELRSAVRAVAAGEPVLAAGVTRTVMDAV